MKGWEPSEIVFWIIVAIIVGAIMFLFANELLMGYLDVDVNFLTPSEHVTQSGEVGSNVNPTCQAVCSANSFADWTCESGAACQTGETPALGSCISGTCCCSGTTVTPSSECQAACNNAKPQSFANGVCRTGAPSETLHNCIWLLPGSSALSNPSALINSVKGINCVIVHGGIWQSGPTIAYDSGKTYWSSFISAMHNAGWKVLAWVTTYDGNPNQAFYDKSTRSNMVSQIRTLLTTYGFDGFNDDFEAYPGSSADLVAYWKDVGSMVKGLGMISTVAVGAGWSLGSDGTTSSVYPQLTNQYFDYLTPMYYSSITSDASNNGYTWSQILTYSAVPVLMGLDIGNDQQAYMATSQQIQYVEQFETKYPNLNSKLAGFAIWAYDYWKSSDIASWNSWTTKDGTSTGSSAATCQSDETEISNGCTSGTCCCSVGITSPNCNAACKLQEGSTSTGICESATTNGATTGYLHASGTQILDSNNNPVILRGGLDGLNWIGWGYEPFAIKPTYFQALTNSGSNFLRLGCTQWGHFETSDGVYNPTYLADLDTIMNLAKQYKVYVRHDFGDFGGWDGCGNGGGGEGYPSWLGYPMDTSFNEPNAAAFSLGFYNPSNSNYDRARTAYNNMLSFLAKRYANNPYYIQGLSNEPLSWCTSQPDPTISAEFATVSSQEYNAIYSGTGYQNIVIITHPWPNNGLSNPSKPTGANFVWDVHEYLVYGQMDINSWINDYAKVAVAQYKTGMNMPLMFGEFGEIQNNWNYVPINDYTESSGTHYSADPNYMSLTQSMMDYMNANSISSSWYSFGFLYSPFANHVVSFTQAQTAQVLGIISQGATSFASDSGTATTGSCSSGTPNLNGNFECSGTCCCSGTNTNGGGNTGPLPGQSVYIGSFDGGGFLGSNVPSYLDSLKSYTGKGIAMVGDYESWGGLPDVSHYNSLINSGYAIGLHVQVHPSHNNGDGVQVCTDIYNGVYDNYILQLAQTMSQVNGYKYIGFGEEMNGFWYSYAGSPDAFKKAMQHLYTIVKGVDPTIQIGMYTVPCWGPSKDCNWEGGPSTNEANTPYIVAGTMDDYYPGDAYCDWWGVDIYSGHSLDRQYSSVEDFYTKTGYLNMHPSKPFVIGEIGASWHDYPDENQEAAWMTQMLQFMAQHKDRIRYFLYYDMAGAINSGIWLEGLTNHPTFYAAYKAGIYDPAFVDASGAP